MAKKSTSSLPSLDLHGRTTAEVFDLVDAFISKNHHRPRVRILPGKGTGKIKSELIRYLKLGGYPWDYEVLANGQKNTGCLIVFLND